MKNKHLILISILCSIVLLIYACRRDIKDLVNSNGVSNEFLEVAKIYYATNAAPFYTVNDKKYSLKPYWQDSWSIKAHGENILVVPTQPIITENKDYPITRVVLFDQNGNTVSKGRIIEFVGEKYDVNANLNYLITNIDEKTISQFNGSILKYDISYNPTGSSVYVEGNKVNYTAGISINNNNGGNVKISSKLFKQLQTIKGNVGMGESGSKLRTNDYPCNNCPTNYSGNCDYYFYFTITGWDDNGYVTSGYFTYLGSSCTNSSSSSSNSGSSNQGAGNTNQPPGGNTTPPPDLAVPGPSDVKDPCYEVAHLINDIYNIMPVLNSDNATIKQLSQAWNADPAQRVEYGTVIRANTWNNPVGLWINNFRPNVQGTNYGDIYHGTNTGFSPGPFYWDDTNGYYFGVTHYHPNQMGVDPGDVFNSIVSWGQSSLLSAYGARGTFQQQAFVSAITDEGTFMVTVKNWDLAISDYNTFSATQSSMSAANTDWASITAGYEQDSSQPTGFGAIKAMSDKYPGAFNYYYKANGDTKYTPYQTSQSMGQEVVSQVGC